MKIIRVNVEGSSLFLRKRINGVDFIKFWGHKDHPEDVAYMQLVATQASKEISRGEFIGFDKWFAECEVWDRQKVLKAIEELPQNGNSKSLVKHLNRYTGQLSTAKQCDAFLNWLGVAEPTKARYLSVIRKVAPKLTKGLSYSQSKGRPDPFQPDEMSRMLNTAGLDTASIIKVWRDLGLRTGELAALQPSWIDWENQRIQIRGSLSRQTGKIKDCKSGHNRVIPLNEDSLNIFDECKNSDFPFKILGQQSNFINRKWKPLLKECGIRYRKPYCLRQTCASEKIVRYKGDLARVAYEMGHRIDTLAEHYAGVIRMIQ